MTRHKPIAQLREEDEKLLEALVEAMIAKPTAEELAKVADARRQIASAIGRLEEVRAELVSLGEVLGEAPRVLRVEDFAPGVFVELDYHTTETALGSLVAAEVDWAISDGLDDALTTLQRARGLDAASVRQGVRDFLTDLSCGTREALAARLGVIVAQAGSD